MNRLFYILLIILAVFTFSRAFRVSADDDAGREQPVNYRDNDVLSELSVE